jgi:hypothetical protein
VNEAAAKIGRRFHLAKMRKARPSIAAPCRVCASDFARAIFLT